MAHSFAALVAISREHGHMTAAEFDFSVARAGKSHYADCFADAAFILAEREAKEGDDWKTIGVRSRQILAAYAADIEAFGQAAQTKRYEGYTGEFRQVRYAQ